MYSQIFIVFLISIGSCFGLTPGESSAICELINQDGRNNNCSNICNRNNFPEIICENETIVSINYTCGGIYRGGTLPISIGQLRNLTTLHFYFCHLSGTIPNQIGLLTKLVSLNLGVNQFNGTIPSQIGLLSSLQHLTLFHNFINSTIPTHLGLLTNLITLSLNNNLYLFGSIPSQLGNLNKLLKLTLEKNKLESIPTQIGNLYSLKELNISTNQINVTIPTQLGFLKNLTILDLQSGFKISGSIPKQITNLSNLEELYLGLNNLYGEIPTQFGKLTNLKKLDLFVNTLKGTIPTQLGKLINLSHFNLGSNQIGGTIPTQLGELTLLTLFKLGFNLLNGTVPTQLGNLTQLIELDIYKNQLEGSLPELSDVTPIEIFKVGENKLSGVLPYFSQKLYLRVLYLNDNDFVGTLPTSFALTTIFNATGNDRLVCENLGLVSFIPNLDYKTFCENKTKGEIIKANNFICELECPKSTEMCVQIPDQLISKCLPIQRYSLKPVIHCVERFNTYSIAYFGYENTYPYVIYNDNITSQFYGDNYNISKKVDKYFIGKFDLQFLVVFIGELEWNLNGTIVNANNSQLECPSLVEFSFYLVGTEELERDVLAFDVLEYISESIKRSILGFNIALEFVENYTETFDKSNRTIKKLVGTLESDIASTGLLYLSSVLDPLNVLANAYTNENSSLLTLFAQSYGSAVQLVNETSFGSGINIKSTRIKPINTQPNASCPNSILSILNLFFIVLLCLFNI